MCAVLICYHLVQLLKIDPVGFGGVGFGGGRGGTIQFPLKVTQKSFQGLRWNLYQGPYLAKFFTLSMYSVRRAK